jgi:hypothetical protein
MLLQHCLEVHHALCNGMKASVVLNAEIIIIRITLPQSNPSKARLITTHVLSVSYKVIKLEMLLTTSFDVL